MQTITLQDTLPCVFSAEPPLRSEVWLQSGLDLKQGVSYLVSAESGAGKSSLCDYKGSILFDSRDINSLTVKDWCRIRREEIAYLPQDLALFPELSAADNVFLKNRLTHYKSKEEIARLFDALGLKDKWDSPVSKLSVGQQQRVAIIRLLCQACQFYLMDEPVSHLDEENNRIVAELVYEEAKKQGAAIISTSVGNPLLLNYTHTLKL